MQAIRVCVILFFYLFWLLSDASSSSFKKKKFGFLFEKVNFTFPVACSESENVNANLRAVTCVDFETTVSLYFLHTLLFANSDFSWLLHC